MRNIITFKGENNRMHGVIVEKMPSIPAPVERGESIAIPGRDGEVWRGEGAFEPVAIAVQIWVRPTADLADVKNWLQGEGALRLGRDVNTWQARVSQGGVYIPCSFNDGWRNTVTFTCEPHRYAPDWEIEIAESGQVIRSVYPVTAKPLIQMQLSGDAEIAIGGAEFEIFDLTGAVWLDCDLLECYTATGLANNHMRGSFPALQPGNNTVTWTGGVEWMRITPRWRLR